MEIEIQQAVLNPFLLLGLVCAGIGLVQEAMSADDKPKPKAIAGPAGKDGKAGVDGKAGAAGKDGKPAAAAKVIKPPSDG